MKKTTRRKVLAFALAFGMLFSTVFGTTPLGIFADNGDADVEQTAEGEITTEEGAAQEQTQSGQEAVAQVDTADGTTENGAVSEQSIVEADTVDQTAETGAEDKSTESSTASEDKVPADPEAQKTPEPKKQKPSMFRAESAEEVEEELSVETYNADLPIVNSSYKVQVEIDGVWQDVTSDMVLYAGQNVKLVFEWELDNDDRDTVQFTVDKSVFALTGLNITDSEKHDLFFNSDLVGTYQMIGDQVVIDLTKEDFIINMDTRRGGIELEGKVSNLEDKTKDGEEQKIKFGDFEATPVIYASPDASSVGVQKNRVNGVIKNGDKYQQQFEIQVNAYNGKVTNIDLTDTYDANQLSNPSSVTVVMADGTTKNYASLDAAMNDIKALTLYGGDTVKIQYTMDVNADIYKPDSPNYTNEVSGEYISNRSDEPKKTNDSMAVVWANKPTISKAFNGADTTAGETTWTITVDMKDYYESGKNNLSDYLTSITDIPGYGLNATQKNISLSDFTSNGNGQWTYTYTVPVTDEVKGSVVDEAVKNTVEMTTKQNDKYTSGEQTGTYPGQSPATITKEYIDNEKQDDGVYVTWEITVDDLPEGITNVTVTDKPTNWDAVSGDNSQQKITSEVWVNGKQVVNKNSQIVDNDIIESWQTTSVWDSGTLIFKDSWIEANRTQPIKIRFVTLITQDTHNRKFINAATLSYEDKTTGSKKDVGPATAAFRDTSDLVTKTGEQRDASKNVITYTLQAGLAPLDLVDGQQLVLTDTLPEGLEIVPDTLSLNISGPYNDFINQWTQESVNLVANTSSNPVTFTVTVDADLRTLVERAMQDGNAGIAYLTITYDAKVKDEAAFIKEQQAVTYENTVTGTYEGDPIGGGKAVNTLTPADVVNKVSEYTQSTAPYVHYQITVNPNAVALLGGTGGKLTATDVVGDALRFVTKGDFDNANNKARYGVKIYTTDGIDLLANGQASYTRSLDRHTLSFELPDSTAIIIEYYAYAKPDSELTPENTTNQFSLEGTGNTAENHAVADAMTAYVPSGWASAETGSITLVKYWTDGGEQIALNGSVFKLVKAFVNDAGAIVEGEVVNEALRVTDKDDPDNAGAIRITGLLKNQLYALYEVEADTGMALNREPFYFVIDGSTLVSLPPNVKTFDVSGEIYLYENVRAGGLEITKTIQGNVTKEEAEDALKFKVTWDSNADGEKKNVLIGEYTLADFDYDEDADTWTLSLDNLAPGKYTVEETVYDIEGKPATSVVYSKDGGTTWSSDTADAKDTKAEVDVEVWNEDKNNASTLEYKDSYDAAPEIHLSKKIAGSTKKLEGAELELLDAAGTQVAAWTSGAVDKEFVIGTAPGEIQLSTDTEKHVYTLKETAAPEGYSIAAPVDFIVVQDASGNVKIQLYDKAAGAVLPDTAKMIDNITLTLYDKKLDLNIRKVNNAATGAVALAGAEFELKKGDEVLATVTTLAGKTVLDASKLQADNTTEYTLTETKAPDGCKALVEDIKFKVAEDGKIVLVTPAAGNIVSLEDEGITFRIVNEEYIAISGKKIWDDSNNSDGNRPESVTIALEQRKEGGSWAKVPGKVAEVKGSGASAADLIYTFDDLPKYDENGVAYEYRVVEDDVPLNYECSGGTKTDKYNITNTYTAERISVSVTKVWEDNNNQDGLRTDIYVQLYQNGKKLDRYQFKLNENDWSHEWTDLLKYKDGQPIDYTVKEVDAAGNEVAPTGYIATVSDPVTSDGSGNETSEVSDIKTIEYTITNTHEPEKTSLSVKKVWDDEENNDGIRPDSVTVRLYADNAATGKTQVLSEANNWQAAFTDLDAYRDKGAAIKYTVVETTVANYTVSYAPKEYAYAEGAKTGTITVTNTYKPGETSYTVKKVWADGNNRDGKRPGTIKVQLRADNTPITDMSQYVTDPEATLSAVIELNAADNWTYTWDGLKAKADGDDIVYSVVELNTDGITAIVDGAQVDFDADAADDYTVTYNHDSIGGVTTITNTHTPEVVSLDVEKKWLNSDGTNYIGTLPARVTVRLYSQTDNNPKPVVVTGLDKVLNAANDWKAAWADLPKYADGKLITYTVKEVSVPDGWADTYDTSVAGKITITNTKTATQLAVRKIWDDEDNAYGRRPDNVQVRLLKKANDSDAYVPYTGANAEVELNEGNGWRYTWNLPDGDYTVEELETDALLDLNYTPTISPIQTENGIKTIRVTNTYTVETTSIEVQKAWNDNNNQDGIRPAEVVVGLYADGKDTKKTITLTAASQWKGTFTDLPVYREGKKITYRIIEKTIANYTAVYSPLTGGLPTYVADKNTPGSFTVTNSYTPGKRNWTVEKVWNDDENRDGIRPAAIQVRLYANGEPIDVVRELSEANNWTYTWEDLDIKENGKDISYIVYEVTVPTGYTPAFRDDNTTGITTLTNTHAPELRNISVQKEWNDANNQDGNRPAQITVQLKADGEDYGVPVTLSADAGWAYTWTDLPVNVAGRAVDYTVVEAAVPGYTASYSDLVDGVITITNTYDNNVGKLVITKTIEGDVTKEEAEGALRFKVTKPDGTSVEYTLKDFDSYDEATKTWTKTLNALEAGNYTVEETVYTLDGRAVSVTYEVNGQGAQTGTQATADVVAGQTTKIDFKDVYTKQVSKLVITKTIKGKVTKEEAEGALTFEVKQTATGKTATYTLKDFTYDAATDKYTLELDAAPGGYTVTETTKDIDGYTCKVTYQIDGGDKVKGDSASAIVEEGSVVTVAFENNYKKQGKTTEEETTEEQTTEEKTTEDSTAEGSNRKDKNPKTGDHTPLAACTMLMLTAAGMVPLVACYKKKKDEEEEEQ